MLNIALNIIYVICVIYNLIWLYNYRMDNKDEDKFDLAKDVFMGALVSIIPLVNIAMTISIIILSRKPKS